MTVRRGLRLLIVLSVAGTIAWLLRRRADRGLEYAGPGPIDAGAVGGAADDPVVKARVESELFRDADVPKGDVVIDVTAGVVTVRGEVASHLVDDLPVRIAAVDGVARVDNRLHAPGTTPPA